MLNGMHKKQVLLLCTITIVGKVVKSLLFLILILQEIGKCDNR